MSISAERPFSVGQVVWTPTEDAREHSLLARYMASVGRSGENYDELWQWSVSDLEGFWSSIWELLRDPGDHAVRAGARSRGRCPAPSGSRERG